MGRPVHRASAGIMNVILLGPVWLQMVHLVVADLFWICLVLASAELAFENQEPEPRQAQASD